MLAAKQRPLARPARPSPRPVAQALPAPVSTPRVAIVRAPAQAPSTDLELVPAKPIASPARRDDLRAIAQLGEQYLAVGSARLAKVIFEGLVAHAPDEAPFHLALGLAADRLGEKREAVACFKRAIAADPKCPRAELDLAELFLEADQAPVARNHLVRALAKAQAAKDLPICDKAEALLALLDAR